MTDITNVRLEPGQLVKLLIGLAILYALFLVAKTGVDFLRNRSRHVAMATGGASGGNAPPALAGL